MNVKNKLILATIITILVVGIAAFILDELISYQDNPEMFYGETYFASPDIVPEANLSNISTNHMGDKSQFSESDREVLLRSFPVVSSSANIQNVRNRVGSTQTTINSTSNMLDKYRMAVMPSNVNATNNYIIGAGTGTQKNRYISAANASDREILIKNIVGVGGIYAPLRAEGSPFISYDGSNTLMDPGGKLFNLYSYYGNNYLMDPGADSIEVLYKSPLGDGVWILLLLGVGYAIYIRRKIC